MKRSPAAVESFGLRLIPAAGFSMTANDLSHITDTDWITHASAMPVCLHGDRLTFTRDVMLSAEVVPGMELIRAEKAGDSWDGASIPRIAWSIVGHPLQQEFRWPSYWHDRLCEQSTLWADRRLADAVLLVLLELYGVAYWRRTAMWAAVRLYAWAVWSWRRRR